MDSIQAKHFAAALLGKIVGGWLLGDLIDNGKSAVVLHGTKDGTLAALKVFSPELVEKLGKDTQLERIERERSLIGKHHDNLIKILDGGLCSKTGYCFIAMEYLPGITLAKAIGKIPKDQIRSIITQIASAAHFLDGLGLAHRDIKPDNITLLQSGDTYKAVLLDLGVLRPTAASTITNDIFIGTLQYSSPEFLLGKEEDSPDGWRAVTFYQLGAVLHDLIMRKRIFADDVNPYARLVNAVQHKSPSFAGADAPNDLILLAKNCLIKDPGIRLQSVTWDDFYLSSKKPHDLSALEDKIKKNILLSKATEQQSKINDIKSTELQQYKIQSSADMTLDIIKSICLSQKGIFPPLENQITKSEDENTRLIIISFRPSLNHGLLGFLSICVFISIIDHADSVYKIGFAARLASAKATQENFYFGNQIHLYTGIIDKASIVEAIKPTLFKIVVTAQEISFIKKENGVSGVDHIEFCEEITF